VISTTEVEFIVVVVAYVTVVLQWSSQ